MDGDKTLAAWPPGETEMAARIRVFDWARTPLGPINRWPASLKVAVQLVLAQDNPTNLVVGPASTMIYNDRCAAMIGSKHPRALGKAASTAFPEVEFADYLRRAMAGETVVLADAFMPFNRNGMVEPAWFDVSYIPVRDEMGVVFATFVSVKETTTRVLAEKARDEHQARQAFLLRLSDALRPLTDAVEIQKAAMALLAGHLGIMRAAYFEIDADQDRFVQSAGYDTDAVRLPDRMRLSDYGPHIAGAFRAGRTVVVADTETDPQLEAQRSAYRAIGVRAWVGVPLVKDGRLLTVLGVTRPAPHDWTRPELHLLEEVAERLWAAIERARAETARRASEERLGKLVGLMPAAVYTCDAEGRITFFNRRAAEMWGREPKLGDDHEKYCGSFRLWMPDGSPLAHDQCPMADAVRKGRAGRDLEVVIEKPTGGRLVASVNIDPFYDSEGAVAGAINVFVDMTERKRTVEALREREADLARVQRIGQVGGMDIDIAGGMRSIRSPEYLRLHGLPPEASAETHEDWRKRVHPDDLAQAERTLLAALNSGDETYDSEYRIIRASDGAVRRIHARGDIERDRDGKPVRLVGAHLDVTEQTRIHEALRESETRYRDLFETIDQGFCVIEVLFDGDGKACDYRFLEANPAFERQTGLKDAIGKRMRELVSGHEEHWFETYGRIATTGHPERFENRADRLGRWYEVYAFRVGQPHERRVGILFNDIIERKRAEIELRQRQDQQTFLLKLSDALRAESEADAIEDRAVGMLSETLKLDRCYAVSFGLADGEANITHQVGRADLPPLAGSRRLDDYPAALRQTFDRTLVVDDAAAAPGLSDLERRSIAGTGQRAFIAPSLRRGENNPIWAMVAVSAEPRQWTPAEVALVEEVTERTWAAMERARAEQALRESESRFRQFAQASSGALWIRDAATLAMEYASPAIARIYGVEPDAFLGDLKKWAASIVPEDRDTALEHIEHARRGDSVVHEFRIQRLSDSAFRWIRSVDFPLHDGRGRVQRIGGIAEDITDARLTVEHQAVLLAELQHRVRNIMAIIRSIVVRTGKSATSVKDYADAVAGRLKTIARVQVLLTRAANVGVDIATIVRNEIGAQAHHAEQYTMTGPDVVLTPKAVEVMTLALHELATNALKYGALSSDAGHIDVTWSVVDKRDGSWLSFDWTERGGPACPSADRAAPRRRGFGSELIEGLLPYELGGESRVEIGAGGAHCHIEFPLQNGASILETDAPKRGIVFGGSLDMTGQADLCGQRILVVEDDYYSATDTTRALRGAGAEVLGPCPTEGAALAEIMKGAPSAAVLDINLGPGASFKLADTLKRGGIPFIFTTGYDDEIIPPELADTPCLQKPIELRQLVRSLANLLSRAGRRD